MVRIIDTPTWQNPLTVPKDALLGDEAVIYIKLHPIQKYCKYVSQL